MKGAYPWSFTDEVKGAFQLFDQDTKGFISSSELNTLMKNLGEMLSDEEVKEMLN